MSDRPEVSNRALVPSFGAAVMRIHEGCVRLFRHTQAADDEEDNRCSAFKADGTRCGRPVHDVELGACRLHVDSVRRQREFAKKAAEEAAERERQVCAHPVFVALVCFADVAFRAVRLNWSWRRRVNELRMMILCHL